jgi:hypothetical protein
MRVLPALDSLLNFIANTQIDSAIFIRKIRTDTIALPQLHCVADTFLQHAYQTNAKVNCLCNC